MVTLALLIDRYGCDEVALHGFDGTNLSMPYHYWSDGSESDGFSAWQWYMVPPRLELPS